MAKDIDVKLKLDAKQASKDLQGIDKQLDGLDDTTEIEVTADTGSAESDIKDVADATGRLSKDDTVVVITAKIDAAKADIETIQTELRGLDDDVITPEVDSSKMDHFTESTGKAQGAVHSMAGEALTSLPVVGDAIGPAGEAVGQLTEGLLAGEIGMKDLAAAAVPLVGITVAFKLISSFMETMAKSDAFHKAEVANWVKAMQAGERSIGDIADHYVEMGKVEFNALGGLASGDLTPLLTKAGVSLDQFATMVKKGPEAFKEWAAEAEAAGVSVDLIDGIMLGAGSIINDYAEAVKNAALMAKFHGVELDGEAHGLAGVNTELVNMKGPAHAATIQIDRFKESTAAADLAYRRLTGTLDEQEAWANVNQSIEDYNKNTHQSEEDTRNVIRAIADYVITTDTIPPEKKTVILADLNEGDIAAAELALTELTRTRDIKILLTAVGSGDIIDKLTLRGAKAAGGPVAAGQAYTVGELGPETFVPAVNGTILPHGAVGDTYIYNMTLPPGLSPTDVAAATRRYHRRGGR